jgi:superfamily I DNA/RNA helicase
LQKFADDLVSRFPAPLPDATTAKQIVDDVLAFVGRSNLLAVSPAYRQGDWYRRVTEAATIHLEASSKRTKDWAVALDTYEGLHAVPLMTIHKSKGLEYHTVVFVGLDDGAWFNFEKETHEETAGFFVAFSRAKQRVIFTYCAQRGTRNEIAPLYDLLKQAGVQTIEKK